MSTYWPGTSSYTLSPILSDGLLGVGCVYVSNRFLRQLTRIAEEFGVAVVLTNQARPPQPPSPAPPHKCTDQTWQAVTVCMAVSGHVRWWPTPTA